MIFAWFQWFELTWLYLDISRPQIIVFIFFTHRLVNKLQFPWNKLDDFSKASESFRAPKSSIPYICFQSWALPILVRFRKVLGNRGIFLSSTPRFAQNLILSVGSASVLVWLMLLKGIFNKGKIVQISLHLTFKIVVLAKFYRIEIRAKKGLDASTFSNYILYL